VFGALNRLLVAALVAGAAFVVPSAAFADCGGGPSAQHVYSECVPTGSGGKATKTPPTKAPPTSGPQSKTAPIPSRTARALKKTGKDSRVLSTFVRSSRKGLAQPQSSESSTGPGALGSAFDLGSGPLALLAALGGTALLLLGGSGLRLWRSRHRA
jgi:hypothetical protein